MTAIMGGLVLTRLLYEPEVCRRTFAPYGIRIRVSERRLAMYDELDHFEDTYVYLETLTHPLDRKDK